MFIELAEAGGHLTLAWEENSFHFMAFNCLFLWKNCVGFSIISHRELDVLTLKSIKLISVSRMIDDKDDNEDNDDSNGFLTCGMMP